jgi:hypothetical protein
MLILIRKRRFLRNGFNERYQLVSGCNPTSHVMFHFLYVAHFYLDIPEPDYHVFSRMNLQTYVSFYADIVPLMVIVVEYASAVVIAYGYAIDDCLDPGSLAYYVNIVPAVALICMKPFPSSGSIGRFSF